MLTTVFSVHSVDGNFELALCPASLELRLSAKAAREFDAACEAQKSAAWLPLWKQIRAAFISAAQFMSHKVVDKVNSVPLEAVTEVTYKDGRLQVQTAAGPRMAEQVKMELGTFKLEFQLDAPGAFSAADATAFAKRVAEVKPLYAAYLAKLQPGA